MRTFNKYFCVEKRIYLCNFMYRLKFSIYFSENIWFIFQTRPSVFFSSSFFNDSTLIIMISGSFQASLEGIHKLHWQNFEDFYPPSPFVDKFTKQTYVVSLKFGWAPCPLYPLIVNVVYGCPLSCLTHSSCFTGPKG